MKEFTKQILQLVLLLSGVLLMDSCQNNAKEPKELHEVQDYHTALEQSDEPEILSDYEPEGRLIWQKPELVINLMGNLMGKTVADIGAGTGFFAFRMATLSDKVIATDIDQIAIDYMDSLKMTYPESMKGKVEIRLVNKTEHGLGVQEVDAVLLVNTYMYLENRIEYLRSLKPVMKENPIVLIIDFKRKQIPIGPPVEDKIDLSVVEEELKAAGYKILYTDDTTLDYQYIVKATL
jgi:2-polyprenyl-3-methyl-5-hydroxy-6-metoxy-1,4-benzoquinol methylase